MGARTEGRGWTADVRSFARRGVGIASWEVKTVIAEHPSVAVPLARLRGHGEVVTDGTEIVMEAFVRSALSYAVAAFRLAQEPHPSAIAHHTHSPSTLLDGVRRGVPALLVVREPQDAIISYLIRRPAVTMGGALRGYVRFHRPLVSRRSGLVVGTFDQVTTDLGSVIRRVNERFGTSFAPFESTETNVERILREIDDHERRRGGSDEERERSVPRPSPLRRELKSAMVAEYSSSRLASLRGGADQLYATFAAQAGA
jgi:hypothetical protein